MKLQSLPDGGQFSSSDVACAFTLDVEALSRLHLLRGFRKIDKFEYNIF
jgi:hypothetical protein